MQAHVMDVLARELAHNRATGTVSELPLDRIRSLSEARDIQAAALSAYSDDLDGYALVGTSEATRHTLNVARPFYTAIPGGALHDDDQRVRLPRGILGAQCELVFTLGRHYPEIGQPISRETAALAILGCQPAIGILGRRVLHGSPGYFAAVADFALHVATICGPLAIEPDLDALDAIEVTARINGKMVASAPASAILGHPLEAVVWLARQLSRQDKRLNAGDVVATGSCMPILQVLPGQRLSVDFGPIGTVSCRFD